MSNSQCQAALLLIQSARDYTRQLFEDVGDDEWFAIPAGASTHFAWQMGHLAMAEYALALLRIRGKEPTDEELIGKQFIRTFKKGSTPVADSGAYPAIHEIRDVWNRVHERVLSEAASYEDAAMQESLPAPTAGPANKLGSLYFCSAHEMLHAGQIGMLRRLLGKAPLR